MTEKTEYTEKDRILYECQATGELAAGIIESMKNYTINENPKKLLTEGARNFLKQHSALMQIAGARHAENARTNQFPEVLYTSLQEISEKTLTVCEKLKSFRQKLQEKHCQLIDAEVEIPQFIKTEQNIINSVVDTLNDYTEQRNKITRNIFPNLTNITDSVEERKK